MLWLSGELARVPRRLEAQGARGLVSGMREGCPGGGTQRKPTTLGCVEGVAWTAMVCETELASPVTPTEMLEIGWGNPGATAADRMPSDRTYA